VVAVRLRAETAGVARWPAVPSSREARCC